MTDEKLNEDFEEEIEDEELEEDDDLEEDDESEDEVEEQEESVSDTKEKQSHEKNEYYKNLRLQKKQEEEIRADERKKTILDSVKRINPYTDKPIVDEEDEEEFFVMRELEAQGKDPISDYSSYLKEKKRSVKSGTQGINPQEDLQDFLSKNKDVNAQELLANNSDFMAMFGDQLGKVPLDTLYKAYAKTQEAIKEVKKANLKKGRKKSTVGSARTTTMSQTKSVRDMDVNSDDFNEMLKKALRGELTK